MKYFLSALIIIIPTIVLIIINESIRFSTISERYNYRNIEFINSDVISDKYCSWECHNNTYHCKSNHVKYLKPYILHSDELYFGLINLLKSTGNYGLANIFFLVILVPTNIWYLFFNSLKLYEKIKSLKNAN